MDNRTADQRVDAKTLDYFIHWADGYLTKKRREPKTQEGEFALDLWSGILCAFRELKARRSGEQGWIPCCVDMPQSNHFVLAWRPAVKTVEKASWYERNVGDRFWRAEYSEIERPLNSVTHWMYLPGDVT